MLSSVSLINVSVCVPELYCLFLWFYSIAWNLEVVILSAFFFSFSFFWGGYFGSFVALDKLWHCFLYFCEEYLWYFDVDCFEFADGFGWHGHFENINSSSPWIEYVFPLCLLQLLGWIYSCFIVFFFDTIMNDAWYKPFFWEMRHGLV